jgi:hypothetical protein
MRNKTERRRLAGRFGKMAMFMLAACLPAVSAWAGHDDSDAVYQLFTEKDRERLESKYAFILDSMDALPLPERLPIFLLAAGVSTLSTWLEQDRAMALCRLFEKQADGKRELRHAVALGLIEAVPPPEKQPVAKEVAAYLALVGNPTFHVRDVLDEPRWERLKNIIDPYYSGGAGASTFDIDVKRGGAPLRIMEFRGDGYVYNTVVDARGVPVPEFVFSEQLAAISGEFKMFEGKAYILDLLFPSPGAKGRGVLSIYPARMASIKTPEERITPEKFIGTRHANPWSFLRDAESMLEDLYSARTPPRIREGDGIPVSWLLRGTPLCGFSIVDPALDPGGS